MLDAVVRLMYKYPIETELMGTNMTFRISHQPATNPTTPWVLHQVRADGSLSVVSKHVTKDEANAARQIAVGDRTHAATRKPVA